MSWVSSMGRRFWQAYSEGLVMTCPLHRAGMDADAVLPAAIDRTQDNVQTALRTSIAARIEAQGFTAVRH